MIRAYAGLQLFIVIFFVGAALCAQEADDNKNVDDEYYDFGASGGVTVYEDYPEEFASDSIDAYVMTRLNGRAADKEEFIETDFLEDSGFRKTGTVKYRKTKASEKTMSILRGIARPFTFGEVAMTPFFEIDYDRLPKGTYYSFWTIIKESKFRNVSPDVLALIELEYMLQIGFCNGIVIKDNANYYTDFNIKRFEELILSLSDYPESVRKAKNRYSEELLKIKAAWTRYNNPSENYSRAMRNLRDIVR